MGWIRQILPPYALDLNSSMQRTPYKNVRNVPRRRTNLASNMHKKPLHTSKPYQDVPPGRCLHEPRARLLRDLYLVHRHEHLHPLVVDSTDVIGVKEEISQEDIVRILDRLQDSTQEPISDHPCLDY